jgi:DNA-binding MarR family transcriptional regulator
VSQRELAGEAGLSLGMTNALLKRFVERGWIKLMRLSGRSLSYILTPGGMEEILRRSIAFFSRAARSASLYRDKIDDFVKHIAQRGFTGLALSGAGEFDFLFDYSCIRHELQFFKNPQGAKLDTLLDREDVVFVVAGFPSGRDKEIKPVKSLFCFPEGAKASRILLSRILFDLDEDDALVDAKIGGES